jgi:hypothetical protein
VAKGFDQSWACQCCADHDNIVKAFLTSTAIQLPALALPSEDLDRLWNKVYGAFCKGYAKSSLQQEGVNTTIIFGLKCPELSSGPDRPNVGGRDSP